MTVVIDRAWCDDHPLPPLRSGLDKSERGQVLVIGGSQLVPGATLLTGEAALRVGAGKVQLATIDTATIAIGTAFPESAVIPLPVDADGEIAAAALDRLDDKALDCDALVIGPGMGGSPALPKLVAAVLEGLPPDAPALLDAGAIPAVAQLSAALRRDRRLIITPHHGELAKLEDCDIEAIAADPEGAARAAADRHCVTVVLKAAETFIAAPGERIVKYVSEAVGLGTAGSGDVLAGAIAGLLARQVAPPTAIGWGVRTHGEAGRRAGIEIAPIGYLARDLLRFLPALTGDVAALASPGRDR